MNRIEPIDKPQITYAYIINNEAEKAILSKTYKTHPQDHLVIQKSNMGSVITVNNICLKFANHNVTTRDITLYEDHNYVTGCPGTYVVSFLTEGLGQERLYSLNKCKYSQTPELISYHNTPFKLKSVGEYNLLVHTRPQIPNTVYNLGARYNCLAWHAKNQQVLGPHRRLNLSLIPNFHTLYLLVPNQTLVHYVGAEHRCRLYELDIYTKVYSLREITALLEGMVEPRFLQEVMAKSCLQLVELDRYLHFGAFVHLLPNNAVILLTTSDLANIDLKRSLIIYKKKKKKIYQFKYFFFLFFSL